MEPLPKSRLLTRGLTRLIGALASLILLAVSAAMNYLFLSSLGKTPAEAQVLGAASASADLLKAVLPFLILWAWRARRYSVACPGLLVWSVFTVFSLLSAIGFAAGNREAVSDTRAATAQRYDTARSELDAAKQERAHMPEHRAAEIVAEAIQSHKQHRRWTSTKGCRNATVPKSRAYCREYFALRAELAAARKDAALAATIERLRAQAKTLRERGGNREPEPQVSLLSRLFGLDGNPVRLALILLIACLDLLQKSGERFLKQVQSRDQRLSERRRSADQYRYRCGLCPLNLPPMPLSGNEAAAAGRKGWRSALFLLLGVALAAPGYRPAPRTRDRHHRNFAIVLIPLM